MSSATLLKNDDVRSIHLMSIQIERFDFENFLNQKTILTTLLIISNQVFLKRFKLIDSNFKNKEKLIKIWSMV